MRNAQEVLCNRKGVHSPHISGGSVRQFVHCDIACASRSQRSVASCKSDLCLASQPYIRYAAQYMILPDLPPFVGGSLEHLGRGPRHPKVVHPGSLCRNGEILSSIAASVNTKRTTRTPADQPYTRSWWCSVSCSSFRCPASRRRRGPGKGTSHNQVCTSPCPDAYSVAGLRTIEWVGTRKFF